MTSEDARIAQIQDSHRQHASDACIWVPREKVAASLSCADVDLLFTEIASLTHAREKAQQQLADARVASDEWDRMLSKSEAEVSRLRAALHALIDRWRQDAQDSRDHDERAITNDFASELEQLLAAPDRPEEAP